MELALKTAEDARPADLDGWLGKYGLEVSCISTGQGFSVLNLYFTHPDQARRSELIGVFQGLIRLAKDYGKMVNVGRVRGFYSQERSREEVERLFLETAETICDVAESDGVTICTTRQEKGPDKGLSQVDFRKGRRPDPARVGAPFYVPGSR